MVVSFGSVFGPIFFYLGDSIFFTILALFVSKIGDVYNWYPDILCIYLYM